MFDTNWPEDGSGSLLMLALTVGVAAASYYLVSYFNTEADLTAAEPRTAAVAAAEPGPAAELGTTAVAGGSTALLKKSEAVRVFINSLTLSEIPLSAELAESKEVNALRKVVKYCSGGADKFNYREENKHDLTVATPFILELLNELEFNTKETLYFFLVQVMNDFGLKLEINDDGQTALWDCVLQRREEKMLHGEPRPRRGADVNDMFAVSNSGRSHSGVASEEESNVESYL